MLFALLSPSANNIQRVHIQHTYIEYAKLLLHLAHRCSQTLVGRIGSLFNLRSAGSLEHSNTMPGTLVFYFARASRSHVRQTRKTQANGIPKGFPLVGGSTVLPPPVGVIELAGGEGWG